jgi:cellulose synthase/poly-beta-1,6-N-acetylglucosamine synthase-like glycosyltransferase
VILAGLALAAALAWAVLLLGRGGFWRADVDDRDASALPEPASGWPAVAAVVPARDEAATVGATVASLLAQDYPGSLRILLVDDRSRDGTAAVARAAARGDPRLTVVPGRPRPAGSGPASSGRCSRGWSGWGRGHRPTICCSPTPTSGTRRTACAASWRGRRQGGVCWSR